MKEIKRLQKGRRFSEVVVYNGHIYISGQVDLTSSRSAEKQTEEILKTIDELLAKAGSDKEHILRCTVYLAKMGDFHEMNQAWDRWVSPDNPPARSVIEGALPDPAWMVQISALAVVAS